MFTRKYENVQSMGIRNKNVYFNKKMYKKGQLRIILILN